MKRPLEVVVLGFVTLVLFSMLTLSWLTRCLAQDSPSPPPLHLPDIVGLLKGGVSATRVATIVHDRGVDFALTAETENQIRAAGGDDSLLLAIADSKKIVPFVMAAAGQQQKVIQDKPEYNAYMAALNTPDPAARAAALEDFARQYPQSVVVSDALDQAMAGYQQAGNTDKVEETAKRILQRTPTNVRTLAIVVAISRAKATTGDQPALQECCAAAQTGLKQLPGWSKPEGLSYGDFQKLNAQMASIFNGASGFCALQNKDYNGARGFYEKVFQLDPTSLQDLYQLAVANLQMKPIDVTGLWYCGKAINLAQRGNDMRAVNSMADYCKAHYRRYHGSDEGWEQIVAGAATENVLPADFSTRIKTAPTPCELAVQAAQQNDPAELSFADKEFILSRANCSPANKAAADKTWQSLLDMQKGGAARIKIPQVKVISLTQDSIDAAITDENKSANKADVHVIMEKPMLHAPTLGSTTDIIGVLTRFTPEPFMFTMEQGTSK